MNTNIDQMTALRNLMARNSEIKLEYAGDTETVVTILPVNGDYIVIVSVGSAVLKGYDPIRCTSRDEAVQVANELAAELHTNTIRGGR